MSLPPGVAREVGRRLGGELEAGPVGGGCIHPAFRVRGAEGEAFLKLGGTAPEGVFEVEAEGLRWLGERAGGAVRIPRVLAHGRAEEPWLMLEWLDPEVAGAEEWGALGGGLAELHRAGDGRWGWERDGFIGPLRQENASAGSWAEFWLRHRLEPQRRLAERKGLPVGEASAWRSLAGELPRLLAAAEEEGPSPLHGDLWSGNALPTTGGVALVDPAPYRGHREVDLAMARLFGGFPAAFFDSYEAAWPLLAEGAERRLACYQLYYLLVHLNLFGAAYAAGTDRALREALGG